MKALTDDEGPTSRCSWQGTYHFLGVRQIDWTWDPFEGIPDVASAPVYRQTRIPVAKGAKTVGAMRAASGLSTPELPLGVYASGSL